MAWQGYSNARSFCYHQPFDDNSRLCPTPEAHDVLNHGLSSTRTLRVPSRRADLSCRRQVVLRTQLVAKPVVLPGDKATG